MFLGQHTSRYVATMGNGVYARERRVILLLLVVLRFLVRCHLQ
jgi:hypothetical protein